MSNMDRFTIHSQLQHLQSKYPGTGNADTSRLDWGLNIMRDTLASHVGHYSRLAYFAVAENESIRRIRYRCLSQMVNPIEVEGAAAAEASAASVETGQETGKETDKDAARETAAKEERKADEEPLEKEDEGEAPMEEGDDL